MPPHIVYKADFKPVECMKKRLRSVFQLISGLWNVKKGAAVCFSALCPNAVSTSAFCLLLRQRHSTELHCVTDLSAIAYCSTLCLSIPDMHIHRCISVHTC